MVQEVSIYCLYTDFYAIGVVCGPFKSKISIPCSFIVFLHVFFVGFQSQVLYGITFLLLQDLWVGSWYRTISTWSFVVPFQLWILPRWDFFCPSYPSWCCPFTLHWYLCSPNVMSLRRKLFYMYLYLCCVCRKRCIQVFHAAILNPLEK